MRRQYARPVSISCGSRRHNLISRLWVLLRRSVTSDMRRHRKTLTYLLLQDDRCHRLMHRPLNVFSFYRAMLRIRGTSHGPVSVTSRSSTRTAEWIGLVFGMWAPFHPSYTVLKGNLVISKNKGTSLWNFVLNSGFRKFRHGISIVETCYQLSSRKVDAQSVINWAVVG